MTRWEYAQLTRYWRGNFISVSILIVYILSLNMDGLKATITNKSVALRFLSAEQAHAVLRNHKNVSHL
jgi:hypothetical protein